MSEVSQDDKTMGMIAHLSGIVTGFIGPLVIWLINKDKTDKDWVITEAKEALNFQITVLIAMMISGALTVVLIGLLMIPAVAIAALVLAIMAGLKANSGESYRYPLTIRLIK
jgi:uncharacterized protein